MNHKTDFDDLTRRVEEIKKEKETSRLEDANRRKYQMWKRDNPRLRSAEGLLFGQFTIIGPIDGSKTNRQVFNFYLVIQKFSDIDLH